MSEHNPFGASFEQAAPSVPAAGPAAWQFEFSGPFSVGVSLSRGWEVFTRQFGPLVGVALLFVVITLCTWGVEFVAGAVIPVCGNFLSLAIGVFLMAPIQGGAVYLGVRAARGEPIAIDQMFDGFRRYWPIVAVTLLVNLIYLAAAVPFACIFGIGIFGVLSATQTQAVEPVVLVILISACVLLMMIVMLLLQARLAFAIPACLDPVVSADVGGAISYSWRVTGPHWIPLAGLHLLVILIVMGSFLLLGVGIVLLGLPLWLTILGAAYAGLTGPVTAGTSCVRCGYDLTGTQGSVCPECGWGGAAAAGADPLLGM